MIKILNNFWNIANFNLRILTLRPEHKILENKNRFRFDLSILLTEYFCLSQQPFMLEIFFIDFYIEILTEIPN